MNKNQALGIILFIIFLSILFGSQLSKLKFNYVLEDFFPVNDPELTYYQKFKQEFEEDNNYLLIGIVSENGIFNPHFLQEVDRITNQFAAIHGIEDVHSITNVHRTIIGPAGTFTLPLVHWKDQKKLSADSVFLIKSELYKGNLISEDASSVAIILRHHQLLNGHNARNLLLDIQNVLKSVDKNNIHIAGKLYAQSVFIQTMQKELVLFLSASLVLIVIFLSIAYRSYILVILPLIIVLLSALWILGIMALTGKPLDILMVLLPTIMFVVGMSDVVHLLTKYIEQLRLGMNKKDAIRLTFKEVGMATFLTSLTTAVGFFTLLTASIHPIREFGIYTGIGVFIAFIVTFSLLPSCLSLLKKPKIASKFTPRSGWIRFLSKSFIMMIRNSRIIIILTIVLFGFSLFGLQKIVINSHLIEDLPNDRPLKMDFAFFDTNYGGSRPFEMTVQVLDKNKNVFSEEIIAQENIVQNYLEKVYGVGNLFDPVMIVKGVRQAAFGGQPVEFKLPENASEWQRVKKYLPRIIRTQATENYLANNAHKARISGRVGDIGSAISLRKTAELREFIALETNQNLVHFTVTGTSNLIDKNNVYLARNMFFGLGIAFMVIAIIAGLLYRSVRMILITLIPNIIPLLLVAGIMGLSGITLKLSTSIVFTIAFGIAVDDTIHFISKLRLELNKGKSLIYALKRTYLSTGKAIIVTSIILSGGFLTLLLSDFGGTFYTGLLISLTLIFALIFDLTLLPVLIFKYHHRKQKKRI